MRGVLPALALLGLFVTACSGDLDEDARSTGARQTKKAPAATAATSADAKTAAVQSACSAVTAPTSLAAVSDAKELHLAGIGVFYQSGTKIMRVLQNGANGKEVFSAPNMVHSYVDTTVFATLESTPDNPNATVRIVKAPAVADGQAAPAFPEFPATAADGGAASATAFNAASSRIFASDATSIYITADTAGAGSIQKVNKDDPNTRAALVDNTGTITDAQLVNGAIWYVRDGQRVYKIPLDKGDGTPGEATEMFGISYASCSLAVTDSGAFCSVGTMIEKRDLTGAHPVTLLDATKSVSPASFGEAVSITSSLVVRSDDADPQIQHVLRAVDTASASAADKLLACKRGMISEVAADSGHVVWIEDGKNVFIAPR